MWWSVSGGDAPTAASQRRRAHRRPTTPPPHPLCVLAWVCSASTARTCCTCATKSSRPRCGDTRARHTTPRHLGSALHPRCIHHPPHHHRRPPAGVPVAGVQPRRQAAARGQGEGGGWWRRWGRGARGGPSASGGDLSGAPTVPPLPPPPPFARSPVEIAVAFTNPPWRCLRWLPLRAAPFAARSRPRPAPRSRVLCRTPTTRARRSSCMTVTRT
jgi:hypothetical protein